MPDRLQRNSHKNAQAGHHQPDGRPLGTEIRRFSTQARSAVIAPDGLLRPGCQAWVCEGHCQAAHGNPASAVVCGIETRINVAIAVYPQEQIGGSGNSLLRRVSGSLRDLAQELALVSVPIKDTVHVDVVVVVLIGNHTNLLISGYRTEAGNLQPDTRPIRWKSAEQGILRTVTACPKFTRSERMRIVPACVAWL